MAPWAIGRQPIGEARLRKTERQGPTRFPAALPYGIVQLYQRRQPHCVVFSPLLLAGSGIEL